jgi:hypothetical protein
MLLCSPAKRASCEPTSLPPSRPRPLKPWLFLHGAWGYMALSPKSSPPCPPPPERSSLLRRPLRTDTRLAQVSLILIIIYRNYRQIPCNESANGLADTRLPGAEGQAASVEDPSSLAARSKGPGGDKCQAPLKTCVDPLRG